MSTGKVFPFLFWDAHGILFMDYLEKEKTFNSEYYVCCIIDAFEGRNCEKTTPN